MTQPNLWLRKITGGYAEGMAGCGGGLLEWAGMELGRQTQDWLRRWLGGARMTPGCGSGWMQEPDTGKVSLGSGQCGGGGGP